MKKVEVQPMVDGQRLMAVKLLKELTDAGLKECKEAIDQGSTLNVVVHDPTELIEELSAIECEVRIIE